MSKVEIAELSVKKLDASGIELIMITDMKQADGSCYSEKLSLVRRPWLIAYTKSEVSEVKPTEEVIHVFINVTSNWYVTTAG